MSERSDKYPMIPELRRHDARNIIEKLTALSSAETFDDVFGLETVDERGEVGLTRVATAEAQPGDKLETVVSQLPLVSYQDGDVQHNITLYSRWVTGFSSDAGGDVDGSLFIVDQGIDADGKTFLAATPGRLYRTRDKEMRPDDAQLTLALLQGTNGGEGIKHLLDARGSGDEAQATRIESEIEASLRRRGLERVSQGDFTEQSWADKGIVTPSIEADRQARYEARLEREEEEWQNVSPMRRLGAWALSKVRGSRYETPKDAHRALKERKERIRREWDYY